MSRVVSLPAPDAWRLPPPEHDLGGVGHRSRQRFDASVVERRLAHPPLPAPGLALAADQPVADHLFRAVVKEAPRVVPPAVLEHVADVVRVRHLVKQERPDVVAEHVAVAEEPVHQEAEQVASRPQPGMRDEDSQAGRDSRGGVGAEHRCEST